MQSAAVYDLCPVQNAIYCELYYTWACHLNVTVGTFLSPFFYSVDVLIAQFIDTTEGRGALIWKRKRKRKNSDVNICARQLDTVLAHWRKEIKYQCFFFRDALNIGGGREKVISSNNGSICGLFSRDWISYAFFSIYLSKLCARARVCVCVCVCNEGSNSVDSF